MCVCRGRCVWVACFAFAACTACLLLLKEATAQHRGSSRFSQVTLLLLSPRSPLLSLPSFVLLPPAGSPLHVAPLLLLLPSAFDDLSQAHAGEYNKGGYGSSAQSQAKASGSGPGKGTHTPLFHPHTHTPRLRPLKDGPRARPEGAAFRCMLAVAPACT